MINKKILFIVTIFILIFSSVRLFSQYSIEIGISKGENKNLYSPYGNNLWGVYNYGFGVNYGIKYNISFYAKLNILSHSFPIGDETGNNFTRLRKGGKIIKYGYLTGIERMKSILLDLGVKYNYKGFFTSIGFGIGRSTIKTEWDYYFTDYKEIDTKQYFTDTYERILTSDISFRLGYAYTYKNLISLGVYWERIKYFGKERKLISREGSYTPPDVFAPVALSPDPVLVNPNCYLWGILLEYHFPKKNNTQIKK